MSKLDIKKDRNIPISSRIRIDQLDNSPLNGHLTTQLIKIFGFKYDQW